MHVYAVSSSFDSSWGYIREVIVYIREVIVYIREVIVYIREVIVYIREVIIYIHEAIACHCSPQKSSGRGLEPYTHVGHAELLL